MKAPTLKKIKAEITTEGVTIIGADVATAHRNVTEWANDPTKKKSAYSETRVGHVAALIAIARTGSGSVMIDVTKVTEPVTDGKWNDGAALASYLRSAGLADCAEVERLKVRQTRTEKGSHIFAVTVAR